MAAAPTMNAMSSFYSMNAFEPLIAVLVIYYTLKMINENDSKKWIHIGILFGIGIMNKHTFVLLIVCLIGALFLAGKWRLFKNKWFVLGSLITLLIILPNIIWQFSNQFPSLEFYRNITTRKNVYTPPVPFLLGQILSYSPMLFPIWLCGLIYLFIAKSMKNYRFLAYFFVTVFLFMLLSGTSRTDRTAFAYPALFAGAGMFFEYIILKYHARWLKIILFVLVVVAVASSLPIILPYFPYPQVQSYAQAIGYNTELERGNKPPLPQILADRIGWEEKVDLVVNAYNKLNADEKKRTMIAAGNYGQAGAIELYGIKYGLPLTVCSHNTYYLWSKNHMFGDVLLLMARKNELNGIKRRFDSVETTEGVFTNPYVTSHENNLTVFICRGPKISYDQMLEMDRFYY